MIRIVALRKAITAGLCGAAVMEVFAFAAAKAGMPTVDMVASSARLNSMPFPSLEFLRRLWRTSASASAGRCFTRSFLGPVPLAPGVSGPRLRDYPGNPRDRSGLSGASAHACPGRRPANRLREFFAPLSPETVASLLVSHALFGLTVGSIYKRPVGYAVGHKPTPPRTRRAGNSAAKRNENASGFIFATGIECSYPTIEGGRWRRDEMKSTRHYEFWQEDLRLARAIGITHIRYGPPLHLIFEAPGRYCWDYIDPQMEELREFGPEPIVDLCHFGVPEWLGNLQNPDLGRALSEYAGAFVERFPVSTILHSRQRDVQFRRE